MFYRLIQGDCLEIMKSMDSNCVDFTVTSPPFMTYKKDRQGEEYYNWLRSVLTELNRITKNYTFLFNSSTRLIEICRRFNPVRVMIWYKGYMKYAYRYEPIFIFKHNTDLKINKRVWSDTFKFQPIHKWKVPYENPEGLYQALIKMVAMANDTILDCFAGSGVSMFSCQNLMMNNISIDISEKCCNIIRKRCFSRTFLDHKNSYCFEMFREK